MIHLFSASFLFRMALSKYILDKEMMGLALEVPLKNMSKIGVLFLGVQNNQIDIFKEQCREDVQGVSYKILEHWRNRHPGSESRKELYKLLTKASDKGLIDPNIIQFLKHQPTDESGKFCTAFYFA